jgi:hypothetical protein
MARQQDVDDIEDAILVRRGVRYARAGLARAGDPLAQEVLWISPSDLPRPEVRLTLRAAIERTWRERGDPAYCRGGVAGFQAQAEQYYGGAIS